MSSKKQDYVPLGIIENADRGDEDRATMLYGIPRPTIPASGETVLLEPASPAKGVRDVAHVPDTPRRKQYCESCGHVDSHGYGCPRAQLPDSGFEPDEGLNAVRAEVAPPPAFAPEPIRPLVRRIGASLLRRLAGVLDPR